MPRKIEISHRTIIFTVFFLLLLWFLFFIRDIIITFFVALLIMAIFDPLVTKLAKLRVPRSISVLITYIVVLGLARFFNSSVLNNLFSQFGSFSANIFKVGFSVFSDLLGIISVLIFAFYLLLYRSKLDEQLGFFFGQEKRAKIGRLIDEIEIKLGGWARGELTLMFTVGIVTFLGLTILGVPFALPLAILAGLLEIVPILGPFIAAIPGVIIGLTISPLMALAVIALSFLINQLENYFLVPKIMEKSVGVNPIVTLLSLTIGFRLLGIIGAIISVPLVLTLQVFVKDYLRGK